MKIKWFLPLLILVWVCACDFSNETMEIVLEIEGEKVPRPELLEETKQQLLKRLERRGFRGAEIQMDSENGRRFRLSLPIRKRDKERLEQLPSVFSVTRLDLWDTYRSKESGIRELLDSLPEIPLFKKNEHLGDFPILGYCGKEEGFASIEEALSPYFKDREDIRLLWSAKPQDLGNNEQAFALFIINTRGEPRAPVTDKNVTEATAQTTDYGEFSVDFSLDREGTFLWAEQTEKAAADRNRPIAIVLDDRAYSVPSVNEPIIGGKCSILGGFTIAEAIGLAEVLNQGALTYPLKIISQRLLTSEGEGEE